MIEDDLDWMKSVIYRAYGIPDPYIGVDYTDTLKSDKDAEYQHALNKILTYFNNHGSLVEEKHKTKLTISNLDKVTKLTDNRIQMRESGDGYYLSVLVEGSYYNNKCILKRYECREGYYNLIGEGSYYNNKIIKEISMEDIKNIDNFIKEIYKFVQKLITN